MIIKGIIFDIGNVIQPVTWEDAAAQLNQKPNDYKSAFMKDRENCFDKYERNEMSTSEFACQILSNLGLDISERNLARARDSVFHLFGKPDLEILGILKDLQHEFKLGILSNSCIELERRMKHFQDSECDYLYFFDDNMYLSHWIGAKKPEPKAYRKAIDGMEIPPEELLFIDDKSENIDAARSINMNGILYQNPDQLKKELAKLDVKPPESCHLLSTVF